ncbi:MAG: 30S ribosomal protein S20 [Candidatus Altimarinota bacterium]
MPILKHAIKKMRQDVKKTERNNVYRNRLKSKMKELHKAAKDNKLAELPELLKGAYSIIDKAFKKNLIKRNNAARKKSSMARAVATAMNKSKSAETSAQ